MSEQTPDGAPADEPAGLPEQTRDDTDDGWGEAPRRGLDPHEEWLLEQRPPHWN